MILYVINFDFNYNTKGAKKQFRKLFISRRKNVKPFVLSADVHD